VQATAVPLLFLQLFYQLFAPKGIARKHFNWQIKTTYLLCRQIAWIRQVIVPAIFLMNMANASKNTLYSDSLGRLALIVVMLVMILALVRLLNPERGILQTVIKNKPQSWIVRLRYVWYASVIAIPLTISGFALAGYYLSALELEQKLIVTLRFCFVIVIVHEMVLRWLTLVDRQLALKNARQKRKAAHLNTENPTATEADNQEIVLLDIPKINQQTTNLLNVMTGMGLLVGIWMIWKNILPAFSFVDQIVLWQHLMVIDKQESLQAITLSNLLLAGIYLFMMLIAVNNLPGLMEVLILRRFSFEIGSRYAVIQITRYLLIAVSILCIVNELGGSWSQVQWLVAALSVGLGFGLQEIFANLVSGIILLFERPIRVGDTVTVGDVTGKVSQIQMRATRIVDWDQKELIVPNKTFITDKLINWALSSQVTRLVIPLGIAYGSDVELACKIITETVCNTPLVLAEPKPDVYFLGFGESALELSIRVHVSELGHRLPVTHELHLRLYKVLAEHNIEIPVPRRDIHIRSCVSQSL
jgi:potassium efflux system protein